MKKMKSKILMMIGALVLLLVGGTGGVLAGQWAITGNESNLNEISSIVHTLGNEASNQKSKKESLQTQLDQAVSNNLDLSNQVKKIQTSIDGLTSDKQKLIDEVTSLKGDLANAVLEGRSVDYLNQQITDLTTQITTKSAELAAKQQETSTQQQSIERLTKQLADAERTISNNDAENKKDIEQVKADAEEQLRKIGHGQITETGVNTAEN